MPKASLALRSQWWPVPFPQALIPQLVEYGLIINLNFLLSQADSSEKRCQADLSISVIFEPATAA